MELWIRSQDKEVLIKTNELEIEENMIIGFINNIADFRYLGTYATKERALEVLDEIQNLLKGVVLEKHINKFDIYNGENLKIYEMPEE